MDVVNTALNGRCQFDGGERVWKVWLDVVNTALNGRCQFEGGERVCK